MYSMKVYMVCWLLLVNHKHYGQCCGPAEIGQQYTITSTARVPSNVINNSFVDIAWQRVFTVLYDTSEPNPNKYPHEYIGTITQLTIKNVTKNDETEAFRHLVNGNTKYTCALPGFKRASTPTCETVTLTGNQITTTCTTAEVYPQAKCQFTLRNGIIDRIEIADGASYISYNHTGPQPEGNRYYSISCTLQYPVDGLKPGNWTVEVNMYPDQTNVSLAQGTTRQADNTLMLSIPTVNIDPSNCPKGLDGEGDSDVRNGYIRQGARASCLCTRDHAGNPPGTIGWTSTHGGSFDILSQSEDGVTIQLNSPATFTCQSSSVLDGSHFSTYTPKYSLDFPEGGEYEGNTQIISKEELAGIVIGVFVGTLMLVAVIALIVFFIRKEKAKRKNRNADTGYNGIERPPPLPYQNVSPRDSNYLTINPSDQASGQNSESTNQATKHTYENQNFDCYLEVIEPDASTYNYITDD